MKDGQGSTSLARNTYGQRYCRVLQWQIAAGMFERELVHVSGGCTMQNRGMAHTL